MFENTATQDSGVRLRSVRPKAGRLVRIAAALALSATGLFANGTPLVSAATPTVVGYQADVVCDKLGQSISLTPRATGVHNGVTQYIYYRYWILNRNTNQWVSFYNRSTGLSQNMTAWGNFPFTSGYREYDPFTRSWTTVTVPSASGWTDLYVLPHGRYTVLTEYWNGNAVWTTSYRYNPVGWDSGACTI
jgi:hypothetical protein